MTFQGINRYQAFAIHMAISLVIFFVLLVCITQFWYPGILFDTGNGWKAISLIVGIDLILGPLFTLIIFNHNKKSLKFDLGVIALLQVAALIYGTWTIHSSRPLAIAYINTSFMTLYANAENASKVQTVIDTLNTHQLFYVFDDSDTRQEFNVANLKAYSKYATTIPNIQSPYSMSLSEENSKEFSSELENTILIQVDPLASSNRYLKVDNRTGKILSFVKLNTPKEPAVKTQEHNQEQANK